MEVVPSLANSFFFSAAPVLNEKASPKTVYSFVGNTDAVAVRCEFYGYPAPDVELSAANGTLLAKEKKSAVIMVKTVTDKDFGNFTCKAQNVHGTENVNFELKIAGNNSWNIATRVSG